MNKHELPENHASLWAVLQSLEDGERIMQPELRRRIGIEDPRQCYEIIENLRRQGYLVGGARHKDAPGYFEIRNETDLLTFLLPYRKSAYSQLELADKMEKAFYKKRLGLSSRDEAKGADDHE